MLTRSPPLWASGQSSWLQIQRSWVRFPALPDFLSSSLSGTGSTQELLERKSSGSDLESRKYGRGYPHSLFAKVGTNFADKRRSFGIVRSWIEATFLCVCLCGCLFTLTPDNWISVLSKEVD
jgi:hypothetical protein